jgi:hypothetical protein
LNAATKKSEDLAQAVGELKGLLQGIQTMMANQDANMNRRMDDMHHSNTRRLDDLNQAINQRLTEQQSDLLSVKRTADTANDGVIALRVEVDQLKGKATRSGAASGAGSAAIVSGTIALVKAYFGV